MRKLLAVDLDGTLFFPRKIRRCIPKKNCRFLQKWYDCGNKIALVTSRSYAFCEKLKDEIKRPIDFVCCSSSQIYSNDEKIRDEHIPNDYLKEAIDEILKLYKPIAFMATTKKYPLVIRDNGQSSSFFLFLYNLYYKLQFKRREPMIMNNAIFDEEINSGDVYKIMIVFGIGKNKSKLCKELNKILRDKFPLIESSWSGIVIELTPPNCNKGFGVNYYVKENNYDPDNVYVVGDSGNDIEMFKSFYEHSYCMANAYPTVKKYAKHKISRVYKLDKLVLKGEQNETN